MVTPDQIKQIVDTIIRHIQPERIVLFGSYADGSAHADSDIDLLIVVKDSDQPKHHRARAIRKLLWDVISAPKDILVYTRQEIDDWKQVDAAFVTSILKTGQVLYESKA